MKKISLITFIAVIIFINIFFVNGKASTSNSESYKNNDQITTLINKYRKEYNHEFQLATKEIEQRLYGKWQVGDTLGYSLKNSVTGGALDNGKLELSKDLYSITMLSPVLKNIDGKMLTTGDSEDHTIVFKSPIFAYYQETLEQMKQDDFLGDYSGIEDIDPDTIGTIIIAMGLPSDSSDKYEFITTNFIIINDNIIAVRQSTFYKLQRIDS